MGLCHSCLEAVGGNSRRECSGRLLQEDQRSVDGLCAHAANEKRSSVSLQSKSIRELPRTLERCKGLTSLDVSCNRIERWHALAKLNHLESLCARRTRVSEIPSEFYSLPNLTKMDLSDNKLTRFPRIGWPRLRKLDVSNNRIDQFAEESLALGGDISVLDARGNCITSLPPLAQLRNLEELCLSNNRLRDLKCCSARKKSCCIVAATKRALKESVSSSKESSNVPSATATKPWANLQHIRTLNVAHNKLEDVPDELGNSARMQFLFLNGNTLSSVPGSLGKLACLRELRLQENKIDAVPKDLFRRDNALVVLHLSNNALRYLPTSVRFLTHLTELRLAHNRLEELPSEIGCMRKLRLVDVSFNCLTSLPESVGRLLHLHKLCASDNRLSTLPASLVRCTELRELNVARNVSLQSVPDIFEGLRHLERVDMSGCSLKSVHPSLGALVNVTILRLENNQIRAVPTSLASVGSASEVQVFNLNGNPLVSVPQSVLNMLRNASRISETSIPLAQSIAPGLLLGGMGVARNRAFLDAHRVTHIINLAGSGGKLNREGKKEIDANRIFPGEFQYLDIDVADSTSASLGPYFQTCIDFIDDATREGGVVLCHCWRGVSRSAAICIAYLMAKRGLTFDGALCEVKKRRSCVKCNRSFVKQLVDFESSCRSSKCDGCCESGPSGTLNGAYAAASAMLKPRIYLNRQSEEMKYAPLSDATSPCGDVVGHPSPTER